jgi:hypothetical protein
MAALSNEAIFSWHSFSATPEVSITKKKKPQQQLRLSFQHYEAMIFFTQGFLTDNLHLL